MFAAVIDAGHAWLAVIAAVATVASLYPYFRLVAPMWLEPSPEPAALA